MIFERVICVKDRVDFDHLPQHEAVVSLHREQEQPPLLGRDFRPFSRQSRNKEGLSPAPVCNWDRYASNQR